MVGWRLPAFALVFSAFMLVNAILFHILPTIVTRIFSPGVITAVVLFLPVGSWAYWGALRNGALDTTAIVASDTLGFALMLLPIVLQKTKRMPLSKQGQPAG